MILSICLGDNKGSKLLEPEKGSQKARLHFRRVTGRAEETPVACLVGLTRGVKRTRNSTEIRTLAIQSYHGVKPREI